MMGLKKMVTKLMWVGRATVLLVGLAVILALVFGAASAALGANGQPFILGENNAATALSRLTGNVNGSAMQIVNNNAGADDSALSLSVQQGEAPMRVNSGTKVAKLNADMLDGEDVTQIGINGYERIFAGSAFNSTDHKVVFADCPAGKRLIGGGGYVQASLADPNHDRAPIVLRGSYPVNNSQAWVAIGDEISAYGYDWVVNAFAICAK